MNLHKNACQFFSGCTIFSCLAFLSIVEGSIIYFKVHFQGLLTISTFLALKPIFVGGSSHAAAVAATSFTFPAAAAVALTAAAKAHKLLSTCNVLLKKMWLFIDFVVDFHSDHATSSSCVFCSILQMYPSHMHQDVVPQMVHLVFV